MEPVRASAASLQTVLILAVYCTAIVAASVCGGALPAIARISHTRMQLLISLVGGLMLGIAVFHLFPHGLVAVLASGGDVDHAMAGMMAGMIVMFLLLRAFHFHQHGPADFGPADTAHQHDCDHDHGPHAHATAAAPRAAGWIGVFFGLAVHAFIDGLALGASVHAAAGPSVGLLGLGTFLAIVLHQPLDALSITSMMKRDGWTSAARLRVNLAFALLCPLGAFVFVAGLHWSAAQSAYVGYALAFSAGVFLSIALSDLLPEMEFHSHDRLHLTLALLLGIALAWGIGYLEPSHSHTVP